MTGTVNEAMRATWNAESGGHWVRQQAQLDALLAPWSDRLADAIGLRAGERVLDIGCGCGSTSRAAAAAVGSAGRVVGVDLSEPMLAHGRELADAAGLGNVRFRRGDCQVDALTADDDATPYDVAISRFGVMFFDDPVAAFANVARVLRPGGRLAFVSWAPMAQQEWLTVPFTALAEHVPAAGLAPAPGPGMFGLSDPEMLADVLRRAGWVDVAVDSERRSMVAGGSVDDAVGLVMSSGVGRAAMAGVPDDVAGVAVAAVRAALAGHVTARGVELAGVALVTTARVPLG
jgi:SAM-dependent methyltransferase